MPSISLSRNSGQHPLVVTFTPDTSDMQTILSYLWDFGDGKTSTEKAPEHTYFMAGKYSGSFTITDQFGNTWSTTFAIYGYDSDLTGEDGGTHASFTDKCYRLAVKPSQGAGIVQWGIGGDFPFPEAYVGAFAGFTKGNVAVSLILDNRAGMFYRVGVKGVWQDKVGTYGSGANINSMIRLKESTGAKGEDAMVEHVESRLQVRPYDEDNKGQNGYSDNGFPDAHRINLKMYANGDTNTPVGELRSVTQYGDYVFGQRIENKRLQLQIETTTSEFRIIKAKQLIQNIDKVSPELIGGARTEDDFQYLFRVPDLWVTRDSRNPMLNRATGSDVTGSYNSLTTGPDENSNSALYFGASDTLSTNLTQTSFPSSLLFWLGDMSVVGDIFKFDTAGSEDFIVRIVQPGAVSIRLTNDAAWTQDVQLEWIGVGWVLIGITFDSTNLYVYENGVLKGVMPLPGWLTSYGGTVDMVGASVISMFDIRRVARKVVSDAIQWYYNDVINYSGDGGLLPIMR